MGFLKKILCFCSREGYRKTVHGYFLFVFSGLVGLCGGFGTGVEKGRYMAWDGLSYVVVGVVHRAWMGACLGFFFGLGSWIEI